MHSSDASCRLRAKAVRADETTLAAARDVRSSLLAPERTSHRMLKHLDADDCQRPTCSQDGSGFASRCISSVAVSGALGPARGTRRQALGAGGVPSRPNGQQSHPSLSVLDTGGVGAGKRPENARVPQPDPRSRRTRRRGLPLAATGAFADGGLGALLLADFTADELTEIVSDAALLFHREDATLKPLVVGHVDTRHLLGSPAVTTVAVHPSSFRDQGVPRTRPSMRLRVDAVHSSANL